MEFQEVRQAIIVALFSDDTLYEKLVLKGGNALTIVHRLGERVSMDVDFSISEDFEDREEIKARIEKVLTDRFAAMGFTVFDFKFQVKPDEERADQKWGGYTAEFKIIETDQVARFNGDRQALSRNATVIGDGERRRLTIDISKYEFCDAKEQVELDSYTIFVYSPEMIAMEKLRAICQQMESYKLRGYRTARARDFYDIHTIITRRKIDLASRENKELLTAIFAAKDVPLAFLGEVEKDREFHRTDWAAVQASVKGELRGFDDYFNFVLEQVGSLKALWRV